MATEAAKLVLAQTNTDPAEIDLIVLASVMTVRMPAPRMRFIAAGVYWPA